MPDVYHNWHPIEDLPDNYSTLANSKFHEIAKTWLEIKQQLKGPVLDGFSKKLNREWAIELGQVENLYLFDEETTKALIEHGLQSVELPQQATAIDIIDPALFLQSHSDIIDGIFKDVQRGTSINIYMIRAIHQTLTEFQDFCPGRDFSGRRGRVPLRRGQFKIWPNNPTRSDWLIHQYCPPDQVDLETDNLFMMHDEHVARNVPVDIEAAWFHHRYVQIHPFQDGNGRTARALTTYLYIKEGYLPPVVTNADKFRYFDALDSADKGNLKVFVDYLALLVVQRTEQCIRLFHEVSNKPDKNS
jgi:fido (protein-threonine AMPylation protein)